MQVKLARMTCREKVPFIGESDVLARRGGDDAWAKVGVFSTYRDPKTNRTYMYGFRNYLTDETETIGASREAVMGGRSAVSVRRDMLHRIERRLDDPVYFKLVRDSDRTEVKK